MNIEQAEQKYVSETKDKKPPNNDEFYYVSLSEWYQRFSLWLLKQNEELETKWILGNTDIDGDYLCYIKRIEECGNVWRYFEVVRNSFNTWALKDSEEVIAWTYLPKPPLPYLIAKHNSEAIK